jgi:periplasmic divalent cation tolerance protein
MNFCLLYLTCANIDEADKIVQVLLQKHLIACAKKIPTTSSFWWQGKIENANEVLLTMESCEENFEEIEKEVKKLHSYETPVFFATPITKITKETAQWLKSVVEIS